MIPIYFFTNWAYLLINLIKYSDYLTQFTPINRQLKLLFCFHFASITLWWGIFCSASGKMSVATQFSSTGLETRSLPHLEFMAVTRVFRAVFTVNE
jgi:hypothetical protein